MKEILCRIKAAVQGFLVPALIIVAIVTLIPILSRTSPTAGAQLITTTTTAKATTNLNGMFNEQSELCFINLKQANFVACYKTQSTKIRQSMKLLRM